MPTVRFHHRVGATLRITRLGTLPRYQVTVVDARGYGYGATVWGHGRAERLADQLAERIQAEQTAR